MRAGLFSDVVGLGYEIFLEGENIKLRYRGAGQPPDAARLLIHEIKSYKAEVVKLLKGTRESEAPSLPAWKNPQPQGAPEDRKESLLLVLESIWLAAWEKHKSGYWMTPSILEMEKAIGRIQQQVLAGTAPIDSFREVVRAWDELVLRQENLAKQ